MATFIQYRPAFFDGFDTDTFEFTTVDQLLAHEILKRFSDDLNFSRFVYVESLSMLFAVYKNGQQWGVGSIRNISGDELKGIIRDE